MGDTLYNPIRTSDPDLNTIQQKLSVVTKAITVVLASLSNAMSASTTAETIVSVTKSYSIAAGVRNVLADPTSNAIAITLPDATTNKGRRLTVKQINSNANAVTLTSQGTQTIDGSATLVLGATNAVKTILSNGSNWLVI